MMNVRIIPEEKNRWSNFFRKYFGADLTLKTGIRPCKISLSGQKVKKDIENTLNDICNSLKFFQQYENLSLRHPRDKLCNLTDSLRDILQNWSSDSDIVHNYDDQEKYINMFPHFLTNINDINIHFVYVKPSDPAGKHVLPLLMLHGWPSSVVEFYKVIPLLTTPRERYNFVFEVVIPSLPGFGFSDAPASYEDISCEYISEILIKLMTKLEFDQFYVHCDDWSSLVASTMASNYPQNIHSVHYALCHVDDDWANLPVYLSKEIERRNKLERMSKETSQQFDKASPTASMNTLLLCLSESSTAWAAYVLDKFVNGSNEPDIVTFAKCTYSHFISNFLMHCPSNDIINSIRAYYRYHKFNCNIDLIMMGHVFTGITMIFPDNSETIERYIREISMFERDTALEFIYRHSRLPACDNYLEFGEIIYTQINKHVSRVII